MQPGREQKPLSFVDLQPIHGLYPFTIKSPYGGGR